MARTRTKACCYGLKDKYFTKWFRKLNDTAHRVSTPLLTFALCCYEPPSSKLLQEPVLFLLSCQNGSTQSEHDKNCNVDRSLYPAQLEDEDNAAESAGDKGCRL